MAAGYRSLVFWWFTGYSAGGAAPQDLCPCPTYGHDATLTDAFTNDPTLVSQFTNDVTLVSAWKRGTCNG